MKEYEIQNIKIILNEPDDDRETSLMKSSIFTDQNILFILRHSRRFNLDQFIKLIFDYKLRRS